MNLIIRNTVMLIGIVVSLTACNINMSKSTTNVIASEDRNYIIDDGSVSSDQDLIAKEPDELAVVDVPEESNLEVPEVINVLPVIVGEIVKATEDQLVILVDLLLNDFDLDGDSLSIVKVDNANYGGLVELLPNGDIKYTPLADFNGTEYFKYYVGDGSGQLVVGTVIIEVEAVNDSPVAVGETFNTQEDQLLVMSGLVFNDSDKDGDKLIISEVFQGDKGGFVELLVNGDVRYTPAADFFGSESFEYTVIDGNGGVANGLVAVSVDAVNDIPVAKPDSVILTQNNESIFNLLSNDLGVGDGVQFSVTTAPANGSVTIDANGVASYLPGNDYFGSDEFVYKITDVDGDVSIATVSLQIDCVVNCSRTFKLTWDASVSADIAGYKVYVGTQSDALNQIIEVGNVTQFDHLVSAKGGYYFAVSAVNASAIESELSVVQSAVF